MSSGDSLLIFQPYNNEPPPTDYATLDLRNNHPVLDFEQNSGTFAVFSAVLPRNYDGGGITSYVHWSADGVTANDVIWGVAFERIGDGQQDIDSDGFASFNIVTGTAPGTDGFVTIDNIAFTNGAEIDSIAVGELFRIKVWRDAEAGGDDMVADAELHAVELKET
jgi:hypothetical protein